MQATVMYGAHDVRVQSVPDATLIEPTDALVRVTRACICGSDLWPNNSMPPSDIGNRMGHEFVGVVEAISTDVRTVKKGDLVVAPFAWSDGIRRSTLTCRLGRLKVSVEAGATASSCVLSTIVRLIAERNVSLSGQKEMAGRLWKWAPDKPASTARRFRPRPRHRMQADCRWTRLAGRPQTGTRLEPMRRNS